ncbi:hypothetical protein [Nocardioides panacis]|nr:hypothetical protein [Nocardioides panacis]
MLTVWPFSVYTVWLAPAVSTPRTIAIGMTSTSRKKVVARFSWSG